MDVSLFKRTKIDVYKRQPDGLSDGLPLPPPEFRAGSLSGSQEVSRGHPSQPSVPHQRTMTGAELKETVRAFVEGCAGGFVPFNRGSLPVVSGIAGTTNESSGSTMSSNPMAVSSM